MLAKDLRVYLTIAKKTAKQAGDFLANYTHSNLQIYYDKNKDIKINADKQSEKIIIDNLQKQTNFSILSEEAGLIVGGNKDNLCWIVDPLDGSLNFSRQLPASCISIALWEKNKPILGVVYDFNRQEMFSGVVGQGAWLNGFLITVSTANQLKKAVVATGFPSQTNYDEKALLDYVTKVQKFKKVRLLGSAALSLAYIACGRVDAYMERDIMIWDIAGGVAIALAAGGEIQYMNKIKKNTVDILVTNSLINFN